MCFGGFPAALKEGEGREEGCRQSKEKIIKNTGTLRRYGKGAVEPNGCPKDGRESGGEYFAVVSHIITSDLHRIDCIRITV